MYKFSAATQDESNDTLQEPKWCPRLLSSMLNDSRSHDVTFKTSDGGSMSGHRAVIAAASPVFHAMLYGSMKESNEKEISLPSMDIETFQALMSFVYSGKVKVDSENCYKILEAAQYFNVSLLENKCVDFIASLLNSENCCAIAAIAIDKNIYSLLKKCNEFMKNSSFHMYKIVHTPEFMYLPPQSIIEICNSSDIYIKEIDLFLAIKEWLSNQHSLPEDTIKSIFKLIRYPLICAVDLIEKVNPTGLADPSLYQAALEYHLSSSERFKGLQDQLKLRQYYFNFHVLFSPGIFINQETKGTFITKREGTVCWCFADIIDICTLSNPIQFKLCIIERHLGNSSDQDSSDDIELVLGYKSIHSTSAQIPVGDLPLNEEYDGVISSTDDHLEIKVGRKGSYRKASTAIQHRCGMESLGVYIRNIGDQIRITKL